jgi:hypothetical protein
MDSGIYFLFIGPYYYVGSSKNVQKRCRRHMICLATGIHPNRKLQNVFNKRQTISWYLAEQVDPGRLLEVEQKYLDQHFGNSKFCCNIAKVAEAPFSGLSHTPETKEKMSDFSRSVKAATTIHREEGDEVLTSIGHAAKVLGVHASHIRQWAMKRRPIPKRFRIDGISLLYPDGKYVSSLQ